MFENDGQVDVGCAGTLEIEEGFGGKGLAIGPEIVPACEGHAADFAEEEGRR